MDGFVFLPAKPALLCEYTNANCENGNRAKEKMLFRYVRGNFEGLFGNEKVARLCLLTL